MRKKIEPVKFIATFELGRLCNWLRVLGYDVLYFREAKKRELIITSLREERIILTREKGLSRFTGTRLIRLKSDSVEEQIRQVLKEMRLRPDRDKIFTRCVLCNSSIQNIKKEDVRKLVPPYVYKTQNTFFKCPACGKIYWRGTHWKLAHSFLKERAKI